MKKTFLLAPLLSVLFFSCSKDKVTEPLTLFDYTRSLEVVINDIPFPTEKYLRIPYTLKLWEYEKEGLLLEQIKILDDETKAVLMTINKEELPIIYKDPLPKNDFFTQDKLSSYYLSIQLPVPLQDPKHDKISHQLIFSDAQNKNVVVEGAVFSPRISEAPIIIASPVKGKNWLFINQSSNGYHFYVLFFTAGNIFRSERFAFDNLRLDDSFTNFFQGDTKVNSSYFNYRDTLYAVSNGTVITIKDGRPENHGDAQDVQFNSLDEYAGNYLVLDIGGGHYAFYAHCNPNSFMVKAGDVIKEGDPLALLGNSGNSTAPHLHFQITDGTELFFSKGIPFVLKNFSKIGDIETGDVTPQPFINSMAEENSVISF